MGSFHLPHQHGERTHTEDLHRELTNIEHFTAVSDVFKQLSDPTRVRIFWLLSHQEECVVNIAAMLDMSSPAISHHLRSLTEGGTLDSPRDVKDVYHRAADTGQIRLLLDIIDQMLKITCPYKSVDSSSAQDDFVRNVHRYLTRHLSHRITI